MRSFLVVSLLASVFTSSLITIAQDSCHRQYVVSEVNLLTAGLSFREQSAIKAQLLGRCFDEQQLDELAGQGRAQHVS
jgi:hypothetical protein